MQVALDGMLVGMGSVVVEVAVVGVDPSIVAPNLVASGANQRTTNPLRVSVVVGAVVDSVDFVLAIALNDCTPSARSSPNPGRLRVRRDTERSLAGFLPRIASDSR